MKVNKIHHVAIICSDYEKSKNFYVNILGCDIEKETYRSERKSYKLDLIVGGNISWNCSHFLIAPIDLVILKQEGLDILLLKWKILIKRLKI